LTKSLDKDHSHFVIHVFNDYDYRFKSDKHMDTIVEAIKKCYYDKLVQNLPVYGVHDKVKKFAQSESEAKKGKTKKIPTNQYRLYNEDIEPPSGAFTE